MNHQKLRCQILLFVTGVILLTALTSLGQAQKPKEPIETIDMGDGAYRLSPPPGQDWIYEADKLKGNVSFWNKKTGLKIVVDRGSGKLSWHRLGPTEVAGKYWDLIADEVAAENRRNLIDGWFRPKITLINKGDTLLDGKSLFFMSYAIDEGPAGKRNVLHYLYFPPDFKKSREFYAFKISEEYWTIGPGPGKNIDSGPIHAVIRTFQINDRFASVPGIDGELIRAAAVGQDDLVRDLLGKGANVNASCPAGTPLGVAAFYGHLETIKVLIEKGADINEPVGGWGVRPGPQFKAGDTGGTPLSCAISGGEVQIAKFLIEKGADIQTKTKYGRTALAEAAISAPDLVQSLVEKGADVNVKDSEGRSPLLFAAWVGNAEIVTFLIENKADLNAPMSNGWTPLMQALDAEHFDIALILLNKGADVNLKSNTGWTALMTAIGRGASEDLIKGLIEHGADVNARFKTGRTPLMLAVKMGKIEVARLLIDRGADLNQKAEIDGKTPLIIAAEEGYTDIAKFLVGKGADLNAQDKGGRTALKSAELNKNKDIEELLKKAGAK